MPMMAIHKAKKSVAEKARKKKKHFKASSTNAQHLLVPQMPVKGSRTEGKPLSNNITILVQEANHDSDEMPMMAIHKAKKSAAKKARGKKKTFRAYASTNAQQHKAKKSAVKKTGKTRKNVTANNVANSVQQKTHYLSTKLDVKQARESRNEKMNPAIITIALKAPTMKANQIIAGVNNITKGDIGKCCCEFVSTTEVIQSNVIDIYITDPPM